MTTTFGRAASAAMAAPNATRVATFAPSCQLGRVNAAVGSAVMAGLPSAGGRLLTLMSLGPPRAAMARSAMSGGNALPCQPFLSSISGTPLALIVRARITVGCSPPSAAVAMARSMAAGSWPSTTRDRQPNACTRAA